MFAYQYSSGRGQGQPLHLVAFLCGCHVYIIIVDFSLGVQNWSIQPAAQTGYAITQHCASDWLLFGYSSDT